MKIKAILLGLTVLFLGSINAQSQEGTSVSTHFGKHVLLSEEEHPRREKFKLSGYIQTNYQWGEALASLKIGTPNEDQNHSFSRIGVRRGFFKLSYTEGIATGIVQVNLTEQGIRLKDAYIKLQMPRCKSNLFHVGIFNRPFGHEVGYSSALRETPERSLVVQTLFPNERDLGAMLTLQANKNNPWHLLQLNAGIFAGNGIQPEIDSHVDFIGRLSAAESIGAIADWSVGTSLYYGGVRQGTAKVFTMGNNGFTLDDRSENIGRYAQRLYFGVDMQWTLYTIAGTTKVHTEWITGRQPSCNEHSQSPNAATLSKEDTYIRPFQGGYLSLTQDFGRLPFAGFARYDW